jgi:hypothetical protein
MVMGDKSDKDDNENDNNQLTNDQLIQLLLLYATILDNGCSQYKVREQLLRASHCEMLIKDNKFRTMNRMSVGSFNKLCDFLDPFISMDPEMSTLCTPTCVQLYLHHAYYGWVH